MKSRRLAWRSARGSATCQPPRSMAAKGAAMWMPAQTVVCIAAPPGAGGRAAGRAWGTLVGFEAVRDLPPFGFELQVRSARLELEERREVDLPQAVANQADDDLVRECRHRQ